MTRYSHEAVLTDSSGPVLHHLHHGDSTLDAMSRAVADVRVDARVVVILALPAVSALLVVAEAAAVLQLVAEHANTLHEARKMTAASVITMTDAAAALLVEIVK